MSLAVLPNNACWRTNSAHLYKVKLVMTGFIYYIASGSTGRVYVGSTTRTMRQRWLEHLHYLRKGTHHSPILQRTYDKYGEKDLQLYEALKCDGSEPILKIEQDHIDAHRGWLMNTAPTSDSIYAAHSANRGRVQSAEERVMRSVSAKKSVAAGVQYGRAWDEAHRTSHSIALTGRVMPPVKDSTRENIGLMQRFNRALRGEKSLVPFIPHAFIEAEKYSWADFRAKGLSYREIERITGRARKIIQRECEKMTNDK